MTIKITIFIIGVGKIFLERLSDIKSSCISSELFFSDKWTDAQSKQATSDEYHDTLMEEGGDSIILAVKRVGTRRATNDIEVQTGEDRQSLQWNPMVKK